jgi:hypothetical protein
LSAPRLVLGGETIVTRALGYVLAVDSDAVDAAQFERLVRESQAEEHAATASARFREARSRASLNGTCVARSIRVEEDVGSPGGLFVGCAGGDCHDRSRSFDLSPCLAALVRA